MDGWELIYAIEKDDLANAKELLAAGLSPDALSSIGNTPLCAAAEKGKVPFVKLLLEAGANPDKKDERVTMDGGATALGLAASSGFLEIVRLLLAAGASPSLPSKYKETPLVAAVFAGFPLVVEELLQNGAAVDGVSGFDKKTPLMVACEHRQEDIFDLLLAHGASVEATCRKGKTPLHYGAGFPNGSAGKSHITEVLLAKGAQADVLDNCGESPLFGAARWEDEKVVSLLLEAGASPNVRSKSGETPLLAACKYNTHSGVVSLLVKGGADLSFRAEYGATALHLICQKDELPADGLEALIESGADVAATNDDGRTAFTSLLWGIGESLVKEEKGLLFIAAGAPLDGVLCGAARSSTVALCQKLIDCGADVDEQDNWGRSALHWVAHDGKSSVLEYLLAAGATVDLKDEKGHTPLHLAFRERHGPICELLLASGASPLVKNKFGRTPLYYCEDEFIEPLAKVHPQIEESYAQVESEGRDNLGCSAKRPSLERDRKCETCGWKAHLKGEERTIHCPWCLYLALIITNYKVLHGNPEIPTADTEVEFTYTCQHCGLLFINGWNAMNTDRPHVIEVGTKTSWLSEDGGVTWRRQWGQEE